MKKFLSFCLLLATSVSLFAYDARIDGIYYNFNGNDHTATVTYRDQNYNSYTGNVVIPAMVEYDGIKYAVTAIGYNAFNASSSLTAVDIPSGVKSIGSSAFYGCSSLMSITIPNGVTKIYSNTFYGCSSLISVTIPNSVIYIESYAFYQCSALTNIKLPESITNIDNAAFHYCSSLASITIPDGVKNINYQTFEGCSSLKSITLPKDLISIGSHAFYNCSSLTTIDIPATVASIGTEAFRGCRKLETIALPNAMTSIADYTFSNCSSLKSIRIPESITGIGKETFYQCSALESIQFPANLVNIGESAFQGCSSLKTIAIPKNITSVNNYAFKDCSALSSVDIHNKVTYIGNYAFNGCTALANLTIPESVTAIGASAFSSPSLSVRVLAQTPAELGNNAFNANTILYVPNVETYKAAWTGYKFIVPLNSVVASVQVSAMSDKSAIQQKLGLDSLKNIYSLKVSGTINSYDIMMMRNQMPNLLDIDLSDANIVACDYEYTKGYHSKKDTLSAYSFTGTGTHIRKAILPNSVVCIEENVFNTPYLQEVVLPNNLRTIGDKTFYGCSALRSINLPESLISIGESAFQGAGLTEITIPANVKTIGESAFGGINTQDKHIYGANSNGEDSHYDPLQHIPYTGGGLQKLTIPANSKLVTIRVGTFAGNNNLKYVSILGDSIKSIKEGAFYRCQLDTLILPPHLEQLNTLSFGYCSGLKFVAMPNTLTEVASNAFVGCTALDNIQFPKKLTKIGHHAFADCTNLRNVDIPGLVTDIEEYAFKDCQVKSVYSYLFDPFTIGQNTFSPYANANATLFVPNVEDTEMKYLYDTQWSQFLHRQRMDKDFVYDDFYGTGDINIKCEDDPLKGSPNATLYPGAGLTIEDNDCDTTGLGNIIIGSDGDDAWGAVIAGCNLRLDSLIQNITIMGKKWYFLGFPFEVRIEDIHAGAKYVIYEYDGQMRAARDTTGWKRLPKDQKYLYPGHGYIFQFNFAVSGDVSIIIPSPRFCDLLEKILLKFFPSDKANNKSWNYASNPFLGYYDINDLNITTPITVWDVAQGNYRTVRPGDDDYWFSPYEGFFLQNIEEQDFELTFDRSKAMTKKQMDEQRNTRRQPARAPQRTADRAIINLTLSSDNASDDTRIVINERADLGYELGLDAAKFLSTENGVPQIFSYDNSNVQYAINERPMGTGTVELGLRLPASGMYTIAATRMDTAFCLLDREQNRLHNFADGDYIFSAGAGMLTSRFALVRGYNAPTATDNAADDFSVEPAANGIRINSNSPVQVYNAAGILVADGVQNGLLPLPAGVYMVVAGTHTAKCVVK